MTMNALIWCLLLLLNLNLSYSTCTCAAFLNEGMQQKTKHPNRAPALWLRPKKKSSREEIRTPSVLICGGGPTGLLCAIMLAEKYEFPIDLYDQRPIPPSPTDEREWGQHGKHYLIGLGGRGITALEEYGVWKEVAEVATLVPGRKEWTSKKLEGTEIILTGERKYATHVLARDRLVSVLYKHVKDNYADQINLHFEHDVRPVSFEENHVVVAISDKKDPAASWKNVTTRFVVAADGSARTFANHISRDDIADGVEEPLQVHRYEDDNPRVFKSIPFSVPAHWRKDLNYAVRSEDGRINFDALPADGKGAYVGTLLLRESDEMAQPSVDPVKFGKFLDEYLPQFSSRLPDELVFEVASVRATTLPRFRYVGPRLQHMGRTVLLGDCAHTVKPYFGMGANSALEDVKILGQCIESTGPNFKEAISTFSDTRAPEIAALVKISHDLDRPGALGTARFIIPIILDGIFSKLLPTIFAPNIIRMIQSEEITFREAARRKRLDRVRQIGLLGTSLAGLLSGGQHNMIVGRLAGFVLLPSAFERILNKLFLPDEP